MGSRKHLGKATSQGKCNIWAAHKHLNDASSKGQAQHLAAHMQQFLYTKVAVETRVTRIA